MNGFTLNEGELLKKYGQSKQLEIERLLSQYGTSLEDMREMYPQLTEAISKKQLTTTFPTQPLFFTSYEAAQMGLGLQEGWMLKMTPAEGNGGYTSSLITPEKWEITESDLYISPEGTQYTVADMQALLSMPTGIAELLPFKLGPLTIEDLTEEGQRLYEEYQQAGGALDVKGWLDLRERQQLETEQVFGKVFPQQDIDEVLDYMAANPEGFLADIREIGPTEEMVTFLKTLEFEDEEGNTRHLSDDEIQELFGTTAVPEYIPESWVKDVYWDPWWVGYVNFIAGQRVNFASILPSVITSFFEKTFWKLYPEDVIENLTSNLQSGAEERFLRLTEESNAWLQQCPEFVPNPKYSENPFEQTELFKDPGYYIYSFSSSLVYSMSVMGTLIGVSAAASPAAGIPAAMMVAAGPEAHQMTEELVNLGVPFEDAAIWGEIYGLVSGGIETASDLPFVGTIFKPIGQALKPMWNTIFKGVASRFAKGILTGLIITQGEGIEEIFTQVSHNAILKHYDETQSILEGVSHAYIQAVIASLPFGLIGGYSSYTTFHDELSPETRDEYDGLVDDAMEAGASKQQAQIYAANEIAKTPEGEAELSKAIEAAQEEYWEEHPELTRPSLEALPMTEGIDVLQDIQVREQITERRMPTLPEITTGQPYTATVYRGYKVEGQPLDEGLYGKGTYYTTNREYAETYDGKEVMTVNLKNPFVINSHAEAEAFWNETTRPAREQALNEGKTVEEADELAARAAREWLESRGYDGLIARNIIAPGDEIVVFEPEKSVGAKVPVEEAIPTTEAGMPEAGLQPSMLEEVPAKEVRPEARGKLVQSRLDDYLRLREYNAKAVTDRIAEIKKALETKGRLPKELGLKGNLRIELARLEALQEVDAVESVEELDHLIKQVAEEIGLREMPYAGYGGKAHIDLLRSPTHRLFKGYSLRQLEEMLKVYQQARDSLGKIAEPAPKLPEPPEPSTEDIELVKTDPTPESDAKIVAKFIEAIKDAKPAREATEALKHEELSKRSAIYASILQGGEGWKAFDEAKSALRGPLPTADYDIDLRKFEVTDADIERMFDRIRTDENLRPFEKLNTAEALTNLIMGQIPTEGELVLLEREFGSEFVKAIMDKMPTSQKVTRIALDIANIPRTLKTIADLSATLRQGATLAVGQPIQFAEAFKKELKVIFSEKNFKLINEIVHNNVYADKAERYGLYIAPIEEAVKIEAREEAFRGRLIERVPIIGSVVRASERAYITFLNVLRMETWAYYCRQWEGQNKTVKDYTDLASFINHATGRGDLGALSRAGAYLSAVFFSPRYVTSRLQLPLDLVKTTPTVRKIVARNLVSWVGANLLVIMLLELAGADVEKDPRSSDFGKVRFGNTRIDFWAGFQPYVRNVAQIIAEERKSTRTGEVYKFDPIDIGVNFVRSKLAPIPGLLWSLKSGKTFIGEELSAENAESIIYQELTPLAVQDWIDAVRWSNAGASTIYGLLAMLGVGVQTWTNNWDTAAQQLGLPVRSETLPYTVENEIYDMKDYYSEVGQMIGGATYEMLVEIGNIPELVLTVAKAKDIKREIDQLPNKRLVNINADENEGDTFEQYRAQWLARQAITNEGELAQFDEEYPNAHYGNMSQNQYSLLVEYHSLSPNAQAEFLGKHPELYANPRDEWLRTHPEENAILALLGQSDVFSLDALSRVSSLASSLNVPHSALVMEELDDVAQLRLKNDKLFDLLDAYSGLDDEIKDAEGLTARDRAIQELYEDNPDFRNDMRRIEALQQGTEENPTPEDIMEGWVDRGIIVDEFGANSAEAKLWLLDNKEVHQWALDRALLTDDGSDWNEPVLRLLVQYRDDFDKYEAYGDISSDSYISSDEQRAEARRRLLFDEQGMTSFGRAYYTREASSQGYSESNWNAFVEYSALPQWGSWRERFLLDNPNFYHEYTNPEIGNHPLIDKSKVKPVNRDKIYQQFYDEFQSWDETGGMATKAIENMRAGLDDIEKGGMTFKEARYSVQAYDNGLPEDLVDDYVGYYEIEKKAGVDYSAGWYEDDWFLIEHMDFYRKMRELNLWTEDRDFSKVPTKQVYKLYKDYLGLPTGGPRITFRIQHPELDAWLVWAKQYSFASDATRDIYSKHPEEFLAYWPR